MSGEKHLFTTHFPGFFSFFFRCKYKNFLDSLPPDVRTTMLQLAGCFYKKDRIGFGNRIGLWVLLRWVWVEEV